MKSKASGTKEKWMMVGVRNGKGNEIVNVGEDSGKKHESLSQKEI